MTQMELFGKRKRLTQGQKILMHLETKGSITPIEALHLYQVFRLAARVEELRQQGYEIETDMRTDLTGKRYACYSI
tara:strand:+ start:96 stop:323 length:228 start_codon:yes stop_codon:yes gene_type:complete